MKGAILAGGAASRFGGEPKGLKKIGGERILDRVIRATHDALGEPPVLIANADDAATWVDGLSVLSDVRPHCGSLGGIYTAITGASGPVLVVGWDMPFLSAELLRALIGGVENHDVFLPESLGPVGMEPLCGVYGPGCIPPIESALDDEDFRVTGFHESVRRGTLPLAEVEQLGDPAFMFFNVNTPDDVTEAEELWTSRHA